MKKKEKITFRVVAYTDAAGRFSPTAFRNGNEDNFFVNDDLSQTTTVTRQQNELIALGSKGMVMVIADGMGGANAGEVASQIAIDTIKEAFTPEKLTPAVLSDAAHRQKHMEEAIRAADKNIKYEAKNDASHIGMGSTTMMAWLYGSELTICWCGDSRAYLFNNKSGIRLISQDHSYVQELVNKGLLTYEQTFDHPQNNIITRSLGDPTKEARPEGKTLPVGRGDIILLCSDGLSGVLRDRRMTGGGDSLYPEDNLEEILRAHSDDITVCREALWQAAERNEWYDNVTAILCKIVDGPESKWQPAVITDPYKERKKKNRRRRLAALLVVLLLLAGAFIGGYFTGKHCAATGSSDEALADTTLAEDSTARKDSVTSAPATTEEEVEEQEGEILKTVKSVFDGKQTNDSVLHDLITGKGKKGDDEASADTSKSKPELTKIEGKKAEKKTDNSQKNGGESAAPSSAQKGVPVPSGIGKSVQQEMLPTPKDPNKSKDDDGDLETE